MNRLQQAQLAKALERTLRSTGSLALAAQSLLAPGALPRFYPFPKMLEPLLVILSRASTGGGLARSRKELEAILGPSHTALLLAGEATGNTAEALKTWALYAEKGRQDPAILGGFTRIYLGVCCSVFLFIFNPIAEQATDLELFAVVLSALTLCGLLGGDLYLRVARKTEERARKLNRKTIRFPVLGPFLVASDRALVSRILSWVPENPTTRKNLLFYAGTGTVNPSIQADLGLAFLTMEHHKNWELALDSAFLSIGSAHKNTVRKIALKSGKAQAFFADFAADSEKEFMRQSAFYSNLSLYIILGVGAQTGLLLMCLLKLLEV